MSTSTEGLSISNLKTKLLILLLVAVLVFIGTILYLKLTATRDAYGINVSAYENRVDAKKQSPSVLTN